MLFEDIEKNIEENIYNLYKDFHKTSTLWNIFDYDYYNLEEIHEKRLTTNIAINSRAKKRLEAEKEKDADRYNSYINEYTKDIFCSLSNGLDLTIEKVLNDKSGKKIICKKDEILSNIEIILNKFSKEKNKWIVIAGNDFPFDNKVLDIDIIKVKEFKRKNIFLLNLSKSTLLFKKYDNEKNIIYCDQIKEKWDTGVLMTTGIFQIACSIKISDIDKNIFGIKWEEKGEL